MRARPIIMAMAATWLLTSCAPAAPQVLASTTSSTISPAAEMMVEEFRQVLPASITPDSQILGMGERVCAILDEGTSVARLTEMLKSSDAPNHWLLARDVSVRHQCPQHAADLTAYLEGELA